MYRFEAELWLYSGDAPWHFLSLPGEISDEIRIWSSNNRRAFGSVRVRATIGQTTWSTSLFPDSGSHSYVLPVKKSVRDNEELIAGDVVSIELELLDSAREDDR